MKIWHSVKICSMPVRRGTAMVDRVKGVEKVTDNPFLNLYNFDVEKRNGCCDAILKLSANGLEKELEEMGRIVNASLYVASRKKDPTQLKAATHKNTSDGVIIYSVYGEKKDKIVLIKQFRYPINAYVYEFPAGLVEPGEEMAQAGIREIYEETGLVFEPKVTEGAYTRPFFTTVGMTDESCGTIYGYCSGTPTNEHEEESEDIEIVLADREECKRILKEENVAIMCAYMLMHFIHTKGDPLAFLDEQ